jgi:hypothetical protein
MKKFITLLVLFAASTILLKSQTIMNIHQSNGTIIQLPLSTIDSITYTIVGTGNLATLTTFEVSDISGSTATSSGVIVSTGGTSITQLGVVWSTNPNPTTSDNLTNMGSGSWAFTSYLTGLTPNTTYYVRAYAINSAGTAYGNEVIFTTTTAVIVNYNITSDTTWYAGTIYQLAGRITVTAGVTLTIEPGTIIKGEAGIGANATALLVARGGKLNANGTATSPIIFTSVADEIDYADMAAGNFASPNLEASVNGLWGGVIVLGKAPISASNDAGVVSEVQIEGIPTSDPNGLYGGNDAADNSGTIRYISIRHGGANIGAGNEINGLTLGGVGNGTIIDNIEVVANQDDGIEWFGGTVDVTNVVVWKSGDDAIDTDQAWSGELSNFIVIGATGHSLELDGPEGTFSAGHSISQGSIKASFDGISCIDLINVDNNSNVVLSNLFFTDITGTQRINNVTAAGVTFDNIQFNVLPENLQNHVNGAIPVGVTSGAVPQADLTQLFWTWTYQSGAMSGL